MLPKLLRNVWDTFLTYFIDLSYGWGLGKRFIQGKGTHKWVREEGGAWVRNIFYYI